MSRPFTTIAALLFALGALAHVYRLVKHSTFVIGRHEIPEWCSIVAIVVLAVLAFGLYRESRT